VISANLKRRQARIEGFLTSQYFIEMTAREGAQIAAMTDSYSQRVKAGLCNQLGKTARQQELLRHQRRIKVWLIQSWVAAGEQRTEQTLRA
jgi:hypothetical protein